MVALAAALLLLLGGAMILAPRWTRAPGQRSRPSRRPDQPRPARKLTLPGLSSWRGRGLAACVRCSRFACDGAGAYRRPGISRAATGLGVRPWRVSMLGLAVVRLPGYAGSDRAAVRFLRCPGSCSSGNNAVPTAGSPSCCPIRSTWWCARRAGGRLPVGLRCAPSGGGPAAAQRGVRQIADQADIRSAPRSGVGNDQRHRRQPRFRVFAVAVALQQATGGLLR